MARAVYGLPALWTCTPPNEIRVLPVPHSATTIAVRAAAHRLARPMIAMACAGKGLRSKPSTRGEIGSSNWCSAGNFSRMRDPSKPALARM